jgi:hypothetical protein
VGSDSEGKLEPEASVDNRCTGCAFGHPGILASRRGSSPEHARWLLMCWQLLLCVPMPISRGLQYMSSSCGWWANANGHTRTLRASSPALPTCKAVTRLFHERRSQRKFAGRLPTAPHMVPSGARSSGNRELQQARRPERSRTRRGGPHLAALCCRTAYNVRYGGLDEPLSQ